MTAGRYSVEIDAIFSGANGNSDPSFNLNSGFVNIAGVGHTTGQNASGSAVVQNITVGVPTNNWQFSFGCVYGDLTVPSIGKAYFTFTVSSPTTIALEFKIVSPGAARTAIFMKGSELRYRKL